MALYPATSHPDGNLRRAQVSDERPRSTNTGPQRRFHGALARAEAILAHHCADPDGWCDGCRQDGILLFHPCERVVWASWIATEHRRARAATAAGRA